MLDKMIGNLFIINNLLNQIGEHYGTATDNKN